MTTKQTAPAERSRQQAATAAFHLRVAAAFARTGQHEQARAAQDAARAALRVRS